MLQLKKNEKLIYYKLNMLKIHKTTHMDKLVERIDEFLESTHEINMLLNNIPTRSKKNGKNRKKTTKNKIIKQNKKEAQSDTDEESDREIDLNEILIDDPVATTRAIDVWHKCQELKMNIKQKELYKRLGELYGEQQKINRAYWFTGFKLSK